MVAEQFAESPAVARYAAGLTDMTAAERARRLDTIAGFAAFVQKDPDAMIDEIFDVPTQKYKKRGFYTTKAKEYAASFDEPPNAQLQRSNFIRAFFIANGRRLLTEQPAWMTGG